MSIRILIADDHPVFRSGLKALLAQEADLVVVGETGDGPATVEAVRQQEIDVLLLDVSMPGLSAASVVEASLATRPALAIVVLTMHEDQSYLEETFRLGVRGFVLKKSTWTDLVQAIRAAHAGKSYVDPSMTGAFIQHYVGGKKKQRPPSQLDLLTAREREICALLALGHTNPEIAELLTISERTVETHRMNVMAKLEVRTRAELVRFAIEHHIVKLD
jgi:DNA-binding NarL/FixJ family response regulator